MFSVTYVRRELRRRWGRTVLTALGLAIGVGLVIGIMGVSQGLDEAQAEVLAPLRSVGTDILVTRVAGSKGANPASSPSPQSQFRPGFGSTFGTGPGGGQLGPSDSAAVIEENSNIRTDLAKLGKPGTKFTRDFFLSATLLSFPDDSVDEIAKLPGVRSAVGGLVQLASHQTGTVPEIVATFQTGGKTYEQTVRPDPPTEAERAEIVACLRKNGTIPPTSPTAPSTAPPTAPPVIRGFGSGFAQCLPARFQRFTARFTTPVETIRQAIDPPSTDITSETYTAAGVDPAQPEVGLVTKDQLVGGRWIAAGKPREILLNVAYADKKSLEVGSTVPINGTTYTVAGLVRPTLTGSTADVYFPLATLQQLATKTGRVTQVLVRAKDADSVDAVAAAIRKQLPDHEVVTTKALANQVTGSLSDARKLANRLGGALAVIVLAGAFVIAVLLTLSSIGKRVREIGTLRAIGWSKRRVVGQLLGETMGIGVLGGILGLGIGACVAAAAHAFSPELTSTTASVPGITSSTLSELFGQTAATVGETTVSLSAPLRPTTLLAGVLFALVGGLLAGLVGSWRAARLAPAVALRTLE